LLDGRVPDAVVSAWFKPPANYLSAVVPLFDERVRFDVGAPRTYRVAGDGALVPVAFVPAWELRGRRCARASEPLRAQPPRPLRGRAWWLRTSYRSNASIVVIPNVGAGYRGPSLFGLPPAPFGWTGLVPLERTVVGVELRPAAGAACFTAVQLGWFRAVGRPV
jgi:hypothetical protein